MQQKRKLTRWLYVRYQYIWNKFLHHTQLYKRIVVLGRRLGGVAKEFCRSYGGMWTIYFRRPIVVFIDSFVKGFGDKE